MRKSITSVVSNLKIKVKKIKSMKDNVFEDLVGWLKGLDKNMKAQLAFDVIEEVRVKARKIAELKLESVSLLQKINISESDIKRVIDYVSSTDAILDEERIEEIKTWAKNQIKSKEKGVRQVYSANYSQDRNYTAGNPTGSAMIMNIGNKNNPFYLDIFGN